jgi:hypothetical protein
MNIPAPLRDEHGQLGPAMRSLSPRHRAFVQHYWAYRSAGFGEGSTKEQQAKDAWKLANDDRIQAAIAEEARRVLRAGSPEAVHAVYSVMNNPAALGSDVLRAAGMVLARTDPEIQRTDLQDAQSDQPRRGRVGRIQGRN